MFKQILQLHTLAQKYADYWKMNLISQRIKSVRTVNRLHLCKFIQRRQTNYDLKKKGTDRKQPTGTHQKR